MIDETTIEFSFIQQLERLGYTYVSGKELSPNNNPAERKSYEEVLLETQCKEALLKINPNLETSFIHEAYAKIANLGTQDLMENNEKFHNYLSEGVPVDYIENGNEKGIQVKLLDIEQPENNRFWVVNQLLVKENNQEKRFDVVLYINGIPLVFIELKSATDEKATLKKAYTQIQNYKASVASIFYYNALCVISDGIDARTSSVSAPFSRYLPWQAPVDKQLSALTINEQELQNVAEADATYGLTELQVMTKEMLNPAVLLKLIRYCTVFEQEEKKDEVTGLISIAKIKKVAAYHQYYAVQKAVKQTLRATDDKEGDRKVGVVWHTQGSGKSLSMVFYSGQIIANPQMKNPTIIIITDRNDLDDQLFGTFGNCIDLLRQTPVQANSRAHLKELLRISGGGVIFTTIQKFNPEEGNVFDTLSERTNIVVVADEAHRSQYGFQGKVVELKNEQDEITGSELRYGNAKYLRDALPNASYIGFTGTPIEKEDKSTLAVFGDYIDVYDIKQAVDDGATVPISYESRLVKIKLDQEIVNKIDEEIQYIEGATEEQLEKAKKRTASIDAVVGHPDRIKDVAKDIVMHFEARQEHFEGKAMIVGMTRTICVRLYKEIIKLKPEWHHDDLDKGLLKVVMTSSSDDPEIFQPHHTTKQQRKDLASRMKDTQDELKLVIVRDMWLTGFDAPSMHTIYVDKKMKGANLMQAIARVNRVYKDKPGGLIVDYIGIGQDLRDAMGVYLQSGGEGKPIVDIKEAIAGMLEKFEIVEQMFHGYPYQAYFQSDVSRKLQILLGAQNFILENQKLKERFLKEVTLLSQLFSMSIPSKEANTLKDRIAFFQAIKARINKFTSIGVKSDFEVETAVKQIVDDAIGSDGVVDVFEAAGIKSPSIGILSDEFLLEVKNMQQKNVAFELLKKLLSDEVSIRKTQNIAQGKKFSEMLQSVVKRYHNNQIDSAQVLKELSDIAKEIRLDDAKSESLGLTPEEYAFYSVLSQNDSTKMLDDVKMKELIHTIVDVIRKNATVDWSKREDVRAKLRLTVKKILMRYGYPPDLARLEADKVLAQGENLAELFSSKSETSF
ncbi:type I restriction endonuclease subunit R [Aureivirga marina]|uniref:type I restriction endonuclease subunit R n=1 Tax=Aureivirga marina TaxID=1182451 RepID=UPI0018CB6736|nr:type I restriction endonuclease subunit R [Aureivirga marina]